MNGAWISKEGRGYFDQVIGLQSISLKASIKLGLKLVLNLTGLVLWASIYIDS